MTHRTLYRLVFPNGSSYVGITKQALVDRMGIHRNSAKNSRQQAVRSLA